MITFILSRLQPIKQLEACLLAAMVNYNATDLTSVTDEELK